LSRELELIREIPPKESALSKTHLDPTPR
jgi:hypothetical protein